MSLISTPQVESIIQFSPLPQHVEEGHNQIEVKEPCIERFDWETIAIMLRLALVGMLLVGLALSQRQLNQPTFVPTPPKFFLDSLHIPHFKVSEGEVSAAWDVTLTISNVMNNSNINILRLEAEINYMQNETLAMITPLMPEYELQREVFFLEGEGLKSLHWRLSTTGWEENQPIVDDIVVQAIAEDMQRGVTRFGLHMKVMGKVQFGDGWVAPFAMFPTCNNMEVKFLGNDQQGKAATMTDPKRRECIGRIEWESVSDSID
ncbi:hypothetical protein RJT34_19542 [Clitoria ternatea]|uniref:Uncharacterized protein n=1 Tax=Clitoria ternatea TaxID=43366 RepID=A0AAN9IRD7_CLITE